MPDFLDWDTIHRVQGRTSARGGDREQTGQYYGRTIRRRGRIHWIAHRQIAEHVREIHQSLPPEARRFGMTPPIWTIGKVD